MSVEEKQLPSVLEPQWSVQQQIALVTQIEEYVRAGLKEGIDQDYGPMPGTKKKVLFKAGAEKLLAYFGLWAEPVVTEKVENWQAEPPFFEYTITATIRRKKDNQVQSVAVRSCNSYETKYKYRYQSARCPACQFELRKNVKQGNYYCWTKMGGCGNTYALDSEDILKPGKIINPDIADCKDTVLAMAEKRAIVAATVRATFCSWLFAPDYAPGQSPPDEEGEIVDADVRTIVPNVKPVEDLPICTPKQRADFLEDIERFGYTKKDVITMLVERWPGRFQTSSKEALEASLNARFTVSMRDELHRDLKELAQSKDLDTLFSESVADPHA